MIEFKEVDYIHPNGAKALDRINLIIKKNTINAIVGSNGAGKTTLARHINGLLKATSGEVIVDGKNTKKCSVAELSKKIGMVFQNSNNQLFADTVKNEILFGLNNFKFEENFVRERFEWAMKFFDLEKYSDTSPLKLSGGEKKRLCLASVLAWDPEVIILDEPTVGQDELQKNKILSFIKELNQQNKTIIIISHDIEFLWNLRPNTIVMSNGEIIKIDSAENIFSNSNIIQNANLIKPQIVKIWNELDINADIPIKIDQISKIIMKRG
jgi:energy-coupling factor transport system ATP-binding protein|tara:strand:+ start:233 stop:1036 length:804 start_codon:yes stop_codon:yes gene_type:complete